MIKPLKTLNNERLPMAYADCNTSKRTFSHLNAFERRQVQALHQENKSLQEIADVINCHKSTVYLELKRSTIMQRNSDLNGISILLQGAGQSVYEKKRDHCGTKYKLVNAANFIHFAVDKPQEKNGLQTLFVDMLRPMACFPTTVLPQKRFISVSMRAYFL